MNMCFTWSLFHVGAQKLLANLIAPYTKSLLECLISVVKISRSAGSCIIVLSTCLLMAGWILRNINFSLGGVVFRILCTLIPSHVAGLSGKAEV